MSLHLLAHRCLNKIAPAPTAGSTALFVRHSLLPVAVPHRTGSTTLFLRQSLSHAASPHRSNFSAIRSLHSTAPLNHGPPPPPDAPTIPLTFIYAERPGKPATTVVVDAAVGTSLLSVAHTHDLALEGACEGVCACSTCHVILPQDVYDDLPEPSEDEEDMMDQAVGLTPTSRLGCQCTVAEDWAGIELEVPSATRNFYVDGHVPKPH
mmetsp:Transcript_50773/g.99260  ORF Transcript_50773/g.99260 Transcript_50773/m.99260 type:complete len:208 (-) Transcript_50773:131-754(-)|eukprot:CAMPEP_0194333712 /NCGR_PEP_ID=MMETSP0171-20130528/63730_1 /TAXON_ID=218684 /ORGANISM="Corethron pennatum, Strain L29A3" /LENGTH=207 /DNA_ID=CAMNT_0039096065 /DNA_START=125 /DNA_END=748 /DNA_ORIENTATION=+